jgi:hypothetical protein
LDDDEMVRLKEWPPHLEEVQVPDGGDHNVKFILQQRGWGDGSFGGSHCRERRRERERGKEGESFECVKRLGVVLKGERETLCGNIIEG